MNEEDSIRMELSEVAVGEYAVALSGHYYQIISGKGDIIARSPSLSIVDAKLPASSKFQGGDYNTITGPDKAPLRILSQAYQLATGAITIQVAETLEETYHLLRSFRKVIIMVFPASFIITIIGIVIISRHSFKRVDQFSQRVGNITEKNLKERLEVYGVENELRLLAESFNIMMGRIEESFEGQRRFMSDASHDLRTPATIIKSYCDVTLSRQRTNAEYRESLEKISQTTNKISNIINTILEVARLESEAFALNITKLDLKKIISESLKTFEASAVDSGIKISFSGESVNVLGDRERLADAISNIVDNAIKYNRPEGSVSVGLKEENGWAVVTVTDSGIGMEESDLKRIFERFYRIDVSRGKVDGTGLGLSIVKRIIEAHKGKVEVKSKIGEGTSFILRIPLCFHTGTGNQP